MAARKRQNASSKEAATTTTEPPAVKGSSGDDVSNHTNDINKKSSKKVQRRYKLDKKVTDAKRSAIRQIHFVPLPLVLTVLACSGIMWILSFRDVMATGRSLFGDFDDAYVHFTKSTQFFEINPNNGSILKSKAGGLSSVSSVTTDDNNMGGLFVRKVGGAAGLAIHTQKLLPLLSQPDDIHYGLGHYTPLLLTSTIVDLSIGVFHVMYLEDMNGNGCGPIGSSIILVSFLEGLILFLYGVSSYRQSHTNRKQNLEVPQSLAPGKTPQSLTSKIIARTVTIVSGLGICFIWGRDLCFPGQIIPFIPRDDIYLEWTNAFLHSPPPSEPESVDNGMESPLYVADKYVSQLTALYMILTCLYKFVAAFFVRYGKNRRGERQCSMIWKGMGLGNGIILFVVRLFASAANTASLDLRWHLMAFTYETFILGLYGFF